MLEWNGNERRGAALRMCCSSEKGPNCAHCRLSQPRGSPQLNSKQLQGTLYRAITLANGGDNLAVYTPFFAVNSTHPGGRETAQLHPSPVRRLTSEVRL